MHNVNRAMHTQKKSGLHEVLPKAGLVVSEKGNLTEILCKPKILPLKSITLQKLEEMEVGTASACMHASACASFAAYIHMHCISMCGAEACNRCEYSTCRCCTMWQAKVAELNKKQQVQPEQPWADS